MFLILYLKKSLSISQTKPTCDLYVQKGIGL